MEERSIYTREHSRGAYRAISYSLANFVIYLPVCLIMSVVFTAISYFMIDLPPAGFGFQILAIFMTLLVGNAFATAVSAFVPDPITVIGFSYRFTCENLFYIPLVGVLFLRRNVGRSRNHHF